MKILFRVLIFSTLCIFSCNNDRQTIFPKYKLLINKVDSIQIEYPLNNKKISLPSNQVENFKYILITHVDPEKQRQFEYSAKINLFKKSKLIGQIKTIDNNKMGFANVDADSLNFGFKMTYGIGMYLMETISFLEFNTDTLKKK